MAPPTKASHPGPEAEKNPHTITQPPPCLTVGMRILVWNAIIYVNYLYATNECDLISGKILNN
jgi:hypothetical protein